LAGIQETARDVILNGMEKQKNRHILDSGLARVRWGRRLALGMLFAAIPLALVLFRVSEVVRLPLFFLLIPYGFACLSSVLYFALVPCPRCEKRFFAGSWGVNPVAKKCQNCGLDIHEDRR
jgi:hypothetical protein